jgi:hypothetical protein
VCNTILQKDAVKCDIYQSGKGMDGNKKQASKMHVNSVFLQ